MQFDICAMIIKPITDQEKETFNKKIKHPLQSYEWGQFREKTGVKVIRRGIYDAEKLISAFQLTTHPIPHTSWTIGYLPKGEWPTEEILEELVIIGKKEKCVFIQIEPNERIQSSEFRVQNLTHNSKFKILNSSHPLFTKYTFVLDLTKTEEELLKNMHPKTRYNIKVAKKHGVEISENNSNAAFEKYWELTRETTKRQKFYAHTKEYHKLQHETFLHDLISTKDKQLTTNRLTSHLFTATYQDKVLTTMLFFVFHDTLYYPYGASSNENRNVMHSTLTMWEAIRWGKKQGLKKFDMWGSLSSTPDTNDPWYGFHLFKQRFGPDHTEFFGSFDLIIRPFSYRVYKIADKLRWLYLKLKR